MTSPSIPAVGLKAFREARLYVVEDFLSPEHCARAAREMGAATKTWEASVYFEGVRKPRPAHRKTAIVAVSPDFSQLIHDRFAQERAALTAHFGTPLHSFEPPQFLRYKPGDFFSAHTDSDKHEVFGRRKVSAVIFLNEPGPDTFDGGDLMLYGLLTGAAFRNVGLPLRPRPGLLLAFPSSMFHEVKPVTAGERLSIVSWFLSAPDVLKPK